MQTQIDKIWLRSYDKGAPESIDYPQVTLDGLFDLAVRQYPDNLAIIFQGLKINYGVLAVRVNQFAADLQTLGVKQSDKIALFLPNCPQFFIAYFGILKAGGIAVPANPFYVEKELSHLLNLMRAEIIITLDLNGFYSKVLEVAAVGIPDPKQGEKIKALVVLKRGAMAFPEELINYCRQYFAEFKLPSEIEFTSQLPKNILGKILRKQLSYKILIITQ
jgi:acyl-CoA synthetase (AMP-forming)/AMP-acid ligase II